MDKTAIMGVINVTPDSFSDGGKYLKPEDALARASQIIDEGGDVLDIGAQSTRPNAIDVGFEEELRRITPALKYIRSEFPKAIISVDTFNSKVAESALNNGSDWINDVTSGRYDSKILSIVAEAKCPYVITHSRGNSQSMDRLASYNDVVNEVRQGLLRRTEIALKFGIIPSNIIWDPGLGFAKSTRQNISLIKHIETINSEGFPLILGPSRKRFIGETLTNNSMELRIWGTAAIACRCFNAKVSMLRVHDVQAIKETLIMAENIF